MSPLELKTNQKLNNISFKISPLHPRVGIRNISDYSPFGVLLAERTVEGAFYRNGFQGQERDDEVKGEGNSVNYKYRMHDPRVGRFFAVDPLTPKYPHNSPYAFSENRVIDALELEGLEQIHYLEKKGNVWKKTGEKEVNNNLTKNLNAYVTKNPDGSIQKVKYAPWDGSAPVTWNREATPDELETHFGKPYNPLETQVNNAMELHGTGDEGTGEGSEDPVNSGKITNRDVAVGGGMISILAAPFTAGGSAYAWFATGVGVANGVDDVFTDANGKSGLMQLAPEYEEQIKTGKFVGYLLTAREGVYNIVKMDNLVINIVATFNDLNSAKSFIQEQIERIESPSSTPMFNPDSPICFIAGTLVTMHDGSCKVIEKVQVGDTVLTYNEKSQEIEPNVVLKIDSPIHIDFVSVKILKDNDSIININTHDHPYFVVGKGWSSYNTQLTKQRYHLPVAQMEIGDAVLIYENGKIVIGAINSLVEITKEQISYNLTSVANNHNFFANGILVHNKANSLSHEND